MPGNITQPGSSYPPQPQYHNTPHHVQSCVDDSYPPKQLPTTVATNHNNTTHQSRYPPQQQLTTIDTHHSGYPLQLILTLIATPNSSYLPQLSVATLHSLSIPTHTPCLLMCRYPHTVAMIRVLYSILECVIVQTRVRMNLGSLDPALTCSGMMSNFSYDSHPVSRRRQVQDELPRLLPSQAGER